MSGEGTHMLKLIAVVFNVIPYYEKERRKKESAMI